MCEDNYDDMMNQEPAVWCCLKVGLINRKQYHLDGGGSKGFSCQWPGSNRCKPHSRRSPHEREGHGWRVSYVWVVESEGGTSEGEILCHV